MCVTENPTIRGWCPWHFSPWCLSGSPLLLHALLMGFVHQLVTLLLSSVGNWKILEPISA